MRLAPLSLLLLMACNCATAPVRQEEQEPADPTESVSVPVASAHNTTVNASHSSMLAPKGPKDKFWVPALHYRGEINTEAAGAIKTFLGQAEAANADAVVIAITTRGGSMDAAYDISLAIENSSLQVVCVADYENRSAGMYILEACDKRYMTKRTSLMIHQIAFGSGGERDVRLTINDFHNNVNELIVDNHAAAEHLARRMAISPEELEALIAHDQMWNLDWKQALKVQAVDGVVSGIGQVTDEMKAKKSVDAQTKP